VKADVKFGQENNNLGILVVSILSLKGSVDIEYARDISKEQGFYTNECLFFLFMGVIKLLVAETNRCYDQYLDMPNNNDRWSELSDVTVQDTSAPLAINI
jgi:hypothetical protein